MNDASLAACADAQTVLQQVFGFAHFRGQQQAIIEHIAGGGHALVLMPTGGGKSLCYQIPALLRAGTAIVISPLIALMQDQVLALQALKIRAAYLNSSQDPIEREQVEQQFLRGELDLLYVAPERLLNGYFESMLRRVTIALFAVDEAHCVSQWGHDFRPEYRRLLPLFEHFPQVPRVALTATADPHTRKDIAQRLKLDDARQFVASFDRPNICYTVSPRYHAKRQIEAFLHDHVEENGIIYCLSRKKTEATAHWLQSRGIHADFYHAGMSARDRKRVQQRFLQADDMIICATIAFGMGIDKPDVRFVIHLDLPKNLEGYYQETGRAGRDGAPADALLLYSLQDVFTHTRFIRESDATADVKQRNYQRLQTLLAYTETAHCRRQQLLAYFGETLAEPCGHCDRCLQPPPTVDATRAAQKLLSTVYRCQQHFGVNHVIDVLKGKRTDAVAQHGHERLSVFGIDDDDWPRARWRTLARLLLAQGYLRLSDDGYQCLQLTPAAGTVLKGKACIALVVSETNRRTASRTDAVSELKAADEPLWQALRATRKQLAEEYAVPAFQIFHDSTLRAMAAIRPQTRKAMAGIRGIGTYKLEHYADAFLRTIREQG